MAQGVVRNCLSSAKQTGKLELKAANDIVRLEAGRLTYNVLLACRDVVQSYLFKKLETHFELVHASVLCLEVTQQKMIKAREELDASFLVRQAVAKFNKGRRHQGAEDSH